MTKSTLIHDVSIVGTQGHDSWILFSDRIISMGQGDSWKEISGNHEVIDGRLGFLSRPMVETHTHGGWGHSVESGIDSWREIRRNQRQNGVQKTFLSLPAMELEKVRQLVLEAEELAKEDQGFIGLHLEGPFISEGKKGAHPREFLEKVESSVLNRWRPIFESEAVVSMTVAPELFTDSEMSSLSKDLMLCFGHSSADYETAKNFFEHHGKVVTHCFNAMNGIDHRLPGPIPAAIENKDVFLELIADGVHVADSAMRLLPKHRVSLVTDAIAAAGGEDGSYQLAGQKITVSDGVARTQKGALAGSTLSMERATAHFAAMHDDVEAGLIASTKNPCIAYGIGYSEIKLDTDAGLLLWDENLRLSNIYNL